ncbi:putative membrane protein [Plasmodium gaboni]|uniref:Putative membrane protein n=1 Tax=Plasmodium gaboni TaxID=647221 RepID=A0A151LID3_9APIC|nr:putative membrane protein [Plasmodium gaboni]KYN98702.1 putative membrane protein [Plasmodium gaboni]SOV15311.1 conserved Plasmodium membrane protein, unknown, putative [Plasmodium gaboni]
MKLNINKITFILGIVSSLLLFVTAVMFNDIDFILGSHIFVGFLFTIYTIFTFLIPNTKNSRDFLLSYAVSTACIFIISLMFYIVVTKYNIVGNCRVGTNKCFPYILGTSFGFGSSALFLFTSILSFKLAHVW